MNNQNNLSLAIKQLEQEVQRETSELQLKEAAVHASVAEETSLKESIKTKEGEIKQKEGEIQRLKSDISQARSKISETERKTRRLTEDETKLKREQANKSQELTRVQNEYQNTLKNSGVKFRI